MNTPAPGQCAQNPANSANIRAVIIPTNTNPADCSTVTPVSRLALTVALYWTCPECGKQRGKVVRVKALAGFFYDTWQNPCGHADHYSHVRLEAKANGLNETGENTAATPAHAAPSAATVHFNSSTSTNAATIDLMAQIRAYEAERDAVLAVGVPALTRLVNIAQHDSGQSQTVRVFLLGLYNGYRFPFNLISLRGLDKELFDDCMAVLTMDARATVQEVHQYFTNGSLLFEGFAAWEGKA